MTSQKPTDDKKARELTSEEAVRKLFHPKVVEHAKRHVKEATNRVHMRKWSGLTWPWPSCATRGAVS